jgi:hypothetical protein
VESSMTRIKCRFCGIIQKIPQTGRKLAKIRKGPATPCKGDPMKLAPGHLENVWSWDEHYEVLD